MKALTNMAIAAIIALVLGFPVKVAAQNTATTDTMNLTGFIDGFRFIENIHVKSQNQKVYSQLIGATDSLFTTPITLRLDTFAGGSNTTIYDTIKGSPFTGPTYAYLKRICPDTLGIHIFKYKVRTLPIPPVINFITAPTQVPTNKLICSWGSTSRDTSYLQRYYSPDGTRWFPFGTLEKLNPGYNQRVDSIVGVNLTGDSIQYYNYNLGGGDSTTRSIVTNYTPGLPWGEQDSATIITNTKNIKFYGRCISNNSITVGKVVLGPGDTLTFTLPASGSVQSWNVTKIGATPGTIYTPVVIFKNAAGSYVSTKFLQVTIPIDLTITGVVITTSTASANFKFTVSLLSTAVLDINKGDSFFISPIASKPFTDAYGPQEATLTGLDTGTYYARFQAYITSTGQKVKVIVPFTIKAPVTGIDEILQEELDHVANPLIGGQIKINSPYSEATITNSSGKVEKTFSNEDAIDFNGLPQSIYLLRIVSPKGSSIRRISYSF